MGMPIKLKDNRKLGLIFAVNYANTRKISDGAIATYDGAGQVSQFNDRVYAQNTSTGAIFNLNYVATKTQINFRNLLNMNTDNNTVERSGMGNIADELAVKNKANLINYNRLFNSIVSLKQIIGNNDLTLNASVSYSGVRRKVPDYRIVNYVKPQGADDYLLSLGDFFNSSTGRFASDLNENLLGGNLELNKQFNGLDVKTDVKVGYFYQNRDRSFWGRSFVYGGTPSEFGTIDGSKITAAQHGSFGKRIRRIDGRQPSCLIQLGNRCLGFGIVHADFDVFVTHTIHDAQFFFVTLVNRNKTSVHR